MAYTAIVKVSYKHVTIDPETGKKVTKKFTAKKPCTFFESTTESVNTEGEADTLDNVNGMRKVKFAKVLRDRLQAKVTGEDAGETDVEDMSDLLDDDE